MVAEVSAEDGTVSKDHADWLGDRINAEDRATHPTRRQRRTIHRPPSAGRM